MNYCCTTPLPAGPGNFTNSPLFVNQAADNFRQLTNSPCVDTGDNDYVTTDTDLDGNPRIVGGMVDIGAYECQAQQMGPFQLWLQSYGLPTDGSADYVDTDGDGMNNWQEWRAGTNPTNALAVLKVLTVTVDGSGVTVTWQSVDNRTYFLQRGSDLSAHPDLTRWPPALPASRARRVTRTPARQTAAGRFSTAWECSNWWGASLRARRGSSR